MQKPQLEENSQIDPCNINAATTRGCNNAKYKNVPDCPRVILYISLVTQLVIVRRALWCISENVFPINRKEK